MKKTPLHDVHVELKAKMAEFAGYDMPIQYPEGVLTEHNWTRNKAGLFDVSHMGQVIVEGPNAAAFLEKLTPSAISKLAQGKARYSVLTNPEGGMVDDLIITRMGEDKFFVVLNAGCKDKDLKWMNDNLIDGASITHLEDRALVALQGPAAEQVLRESGMEMAELGYMSMMECHGFFISRLGYTGEDGFEISVPHAQACDLWQKLSAHADVKPVGLAARDSLRLEMGYPLYGHDIDDTTSPVEAGIAWIMRGKEGSDFIGADRILNERENGAPRIRVGVKLTGKGIAREGAEILTTTGDGIGALTSGGFSPTLQEAIGQGYIKSNSANVGDAVLVRVRGREIEAVIAALPFVQAKTKTAKKNAA